MNPFTNMQAITRVEDGFLVKAQRQASIVVSQFCPEFPYLELKVPEQVEEVIRVTFTTVSHDQGWADSTGSGSFTWFEALRISPLSNASGQHLGRVTFSAHRHQGARRILHRNVVANPDPHRLQTTWDVNTPHDATKANNIKPWLASIKAGDKIQLIPRALYVGWVNFIEEAEIEILGRPKIETMRLLKRIGTADTRVYRPLRSDMREIRLLKLHPGAQNDEIRCSLSYISLHDETPVPFEALSYCWGDQTQCRTIKLGSIQEDGSVTFESDLTVTESLYYALKALRSVDSIRTLWVDAVCINQNDIPERNQQVSIMQQVYSKADRVVIWLGEDHEQFSGSLRMVTEILSLQTTAPEQFNSQLDLQRPHGYEGFENWKYGYIARIFDNPWFNRVWVVQEAFNARSAVVQCGPHVLPWPTLLRINKCLQILKQKAPAIGHRTMPDIMSDLMDVETQADGQLVATQKHNIDHLDVLVAGIDIGCLDPRDKIFAISQLVERDRDNLPDAIRPDYMKPIVDVFCDFTRHWIRENQSLRILSTIHADLNRSWQLMTMTVADLQSLGRPSWSFFYTGNSDWAKNTLGYDAECKYRASGTTTPDRDLLDRSEHGELHLAGVQLGIITAKKSFLHRHQGATQPGPDEEMLKVFEEIFDPWATHRSWSPNQNPVELGTEQSIQTARMAHLYFHEFSNQRGPNDARLPCLSDSLVYLKSKTGSVNLGLCPHMAQVGDMVVVLLGGKVPFILRPAQTVSSSLPQNAFYLVGEAFCQGYMDGKAIQEMESGALEHEQFVLV